VTTTTSGVAGARNTSQTVGATRAKPNATSSGGPTRSKRQADNVATAYAPTAQVAQVPSFPPAKTIAHAYAVNPAKEATSHDRPTGNSCDGGALSLAGELTRPSR
jgi:hypothetical protein